MVERSWVNNTNLGELRLPLALGAGNTALLAASDEGVQFALFLGNLPGSFVDIRVRKRNVNAGSRRGKVVTLDWNKRQHYDNDGIVLDADRRIALLGLASLAREDNKLGLVSRQPLDVERLALLAEVPPAVVDNDANATRLLPADAGLLQFGQGEATALADLAVVTRSRGADSGTEKGKGANTQSRDLGLASVATAELATGLIKPGLDPALPILAEVVGVKD
jgi:hypothetical protein